jgi:hypothetical protein
MVLYHPDAGYRAVTAQAPRESFGDGWIETDLEFYPDEDEPLRHLELRISARWTEPRGTR